MTVQDRPTTPDPAGSPEAGRGTAADRSTLRSAYLYLVCLITFVMIVFAAVSVVRNAVEFAYPDTASLAYEPAFGPDGKELVSEADRERREQAVEDSQRRQAVLGLVGSGAMLLIAGPAYLYHWRRVQSELAPGRGPAATP